jgi:GntR family transcriptional regulator, transcriptional repressor for pyruvate dehydrogenase complex
MDSRTSAPADPPAGAPSARKAAERVLAELRRQIVCGEIAEDGNLPTEGELTARFGVSRTPIREAIRVLEMEGLIRSRQGQRHGAQVQPPSPRIAARHTALLLRRRGASLADVYQAREAIEPFAASLLAQNASRETIAQLKAFCAEERRIIGDARAWGRAVAVFHQMLLDRCGNQTLAVLGGQLFDIVAGQIHVEMSEADGGVSGRKGRELAVEAHERLIGLIERRDADAAASFWRTHLQAAWPWHHVTESLNVDDLLK